jgi:hypothetical protein
MKIFFRLIISILVLVVFGYSCKKDKSTVSNNPQLITSSPWLFSSAQVDQNNDGVGDVTLPPSFLTPCYTDNFLTFSINGSGILDEGLTKCNASDPQTVPFTWNFTNTEKNINFSTAIFPGASGDFKIIKLDASVLILSKLTTVPGYPSQVTVIITFIH